MDFHETRLVQTPMKRTALSLASCRELDRYFMGERAVYAAFGDRPARSSTAAAVSFAMRFFSRVIAAV
jgi:hypothetical protein